MGLTTEGKRVLLQHAGLDVKRLTQALRNLSVEQTNDIQAAFSLLLKAVGGDMQ